MGFLSPIQKRTGGRAAGPVVIVNGKQIKFNKEAIEKTGFDKSISLYLGEGNDKDKLYFLNGYTDQPQYKLNGLKGNRSFSDANVVTVARLGNDNYPIEFGPDPLNPKKTAAYIQFNPDAPVPSLEKREKKPRSAAKDINKAVGDQIRKNKEAGGKVTGGKVTAPAK